MMSSPSPVPSWAPASPCWVAPSSAPPRSSRPVASSGSPASRPPSAAAPPSPAAAAASHPAPGAAPGAQLPAAASNSAVALKNPLRRRREPENSPPRPRPISSTHLLQRPVVLLQLRVFELQVLQVPLEVLVLLRQLVVWLLASREGIPCFVQLLLSGAHTMLSYRHSTKISTQHFFFLFQFFVRSKTFSTYTISPFLSEYCSQTSLNLW